MLPYMIANGNALLTSKRWVTTLLVGLSIFQPIAADLEVTIQKAVLVSFNTELGKEYEIQWSPTLDAPVWTSVGDLLYGTGESYTRSFVNQGVVSGYYRVEELALRSDLVLHYPFNGDARDASGLGNDGMVSGPTLTTNRFGGTTNAFAFAKTGDVIQAGDSEAFPTGTENFTVSLWVRSTLGASDPHQVFFANKNLNQFQLGLNTITSGKAVLLFYIGGGSGSSYVLQSDILDWDLNRWYNLQVTRKGNGFRLFRDGQLLDQSEATRSIVRSALDFGFRTSNSAHQFYGILDDVRIYTRALTDTELHVLTRLRE